MSTDAQTFSQLKRQFGPDALARRSRRYPVTGTQRAMVLRSASAPHAGSYVQQLVFTAPGPLRGDDWYAAWKEIVSRHDVLRSRLEWDQTGEPQLYFDPQKSPPMTVFRIDDVDSLERTEFLNEDRRRGIDWSASTLWRVTYLTDDKERWLGVWTFPHALLDGRSHRLVLEQVWSSYQKRSAGIAVDDLGHKIVPYSTYLGWKQSRDYVEAQVYWQQRLEGFVAAPQLPSRSVVRDQNDYQRHSLCQSLDRQQSTHLRECAKRLGVSLNNLAQGAWGLLLGAYTEATDVTFGVARAGRYWPDSDPAAAVGLFLHTLPFRLNTTNDQPFATWLLGVRNQQRDMREGEHVDCDMIHKWCGLTPATSLFQTILVFENDDASERFEQLGLTTSLYEQTESVVISIAAGTQIKLAIEYPSADHDLAQIERVLRQYEQLLLAIIDAPRDVTLGDLLRQLCVDERPTVEPWQGRSMTSIPESTLSVLKRQARKSPDAIAIDSPGGEWSYNQLHHAAAQIAYKIEQQTTLQAPVAVLLEVSPLQVMTWIACVQSRRIYAPVDLGNPPHRIAQYLDDIRPTLIITRSECRSVIPAGWQVLCLDEQSLEGPEIGGEPVSHPDQIAALLFTSGSTGRPKGVLSTHSGLDLCAQNYRDLFPLPNSGRLLQATPPSFDVSIGEMLIALQTGGTLVIVERHETKSGPELSRTLVERRIEMFWPTPHLLRQAPVISNSSLKLLVSIGEPLTPELRKQWNGPWRFFNAYGPVECAIWATFDECHDASQRPMIGRILPGYRGYVLDEAARPVPIGAVGELYLGGSAVAAGYLNRPEETAFRFLPDPYAGTPGAVMYRTGDRVRWWDDGRLEHLGRRDHQVKFRGVRLELGELEGTLRQHPSVHDAIVDIDGEQLVGWVVAKPDQQINSTDLQDWMADRVPLSLIPTSIVVLSKFPNTSSGKVDRRQLRVRQPIAEVSRQAALLDQQKHLDSAFFANDDLPGASVVELFAAQVQRDPNRVAVQYGDRSLTFAELDHFARRIAARLRQAELPPEGPVALKFCRSPEFIAAALGVMIAGGSYLPLDAEWPRLREKEVLDDSGVTVVLTDAQSIEPHRDRDPLWISIHDLEEVEPISDNLTNRGTTPLHHRAYLIYTSGSTGRPKGVEIEHRALANLIHFYQNRLSLTCDDRVTMLANVAFDASVADLWPALCTGARVLIPNAELLTDPKGLIAWISTTAATFSFVPTALGELMLSQPWPANLALQNLAVGGDTLHIRPPKGLSFVVWNTYGPTENTVDSTWAIVEPNDRNEAPSIGTPILGVRAYVLDEHLCPVPDGASGELFLGGSQVARGYFRRPELTADRFLVDPFVDRPGSRMYRSGDLVRRQEDGSLEFLGRLDDQVQIRGKRVELGEVESLLCRHPRVRQVCCRPIMDGGRCKGIAAHLAVESPNEDISQELSHYLSGHLPAHMIPATFTFSTGLPRTSNGKIDRKKLDLQCPKQLNDLCPDPSGDALYDVLKRAWMESLSIRGAWSPDSDFEMAGGDSLAAMKLLLAVEHATGQWISMSAFLKQPTLQGLYETVKSGQSNHQNHRSATSRNPEMHTPLFCVYTMDGGVGIYSDFIKALGTDQPVYGISIQGLYDQTSIPESLQEVATTVMQRIRQIHPSGPFAVIGYSWSGFLAFEIARQSAANDQAPPFVGLIGTKSPTTHYGDCIYKLRNLFFRLRCRWPWLNRLKPVKGRPGIPAEPPSRLVDEHLRLVHRYTPNRGPSFPLWLWCDQSDMVRQSPFLRFLLGQRDWDFWAGQPVKTEWFDADHFEVMQSPIVEKLAASVRTAMEDYFKNPSTVTERSLSEGSPVRLNVSDQTSRSPLNHSDQFQQRL